MVFEICHEKTPKRAKHVALAWIHDQKNFLCDRYVIAIKILFNEIPSNLGSITH